eukprot:619649-Pyramimonas_sp.AAC.1
MQDSGGSADERLQRSKPIPSDLKMAIESVIMAIDQLASNSPTCEEVTESAPRTRNVMMTSMGAAGADAGPGDADVAIPEAGVTTGGND